MLPYNGAVKHTIITLSGLPGSGKSATARLLAERLGYAHFSSGDFMREIGARHGYSIEETNRAAERDPSFDQEVDEAIRAKGAGNRLVIDSRLAFHWIPDSFKVFLKLEPNIAAERIFRHIQKEGRAHEDGSSVEDTYRSVMVRIDSERKRYASLYAVDYTDETQFDLVVDTGLLPLEQVVTRIIDAYTAWGEKT